MFKYINMICEKRSSCKIKSFRTGLELKAILANYTGNSHRCQRHFANGPLQELLENRQATLWLS